ncbi:MAG: glycosyl hydrolase [Gammaproteobacteria bacterium]|nr:glycosyl hydrolase [Gammaproteobacteria bacterium]
MSSAQNPSRRHFFRQLASRVEAATPVGTPWHPVLEAHAGDGDVLWSGWAGAGEVFVVGDEGRILHFNADQPGWHEQASPVPLPLHGIWGKQADSLHAVGWMGCILHYDGEQWRQVQGGVVNDDTGRFASCEENTPLFAIDGNAAGHAWAVGDEGRILHFDGEGWQSEASGTRINLRAVACAPGGRVYAAGGEGTLLCRDLKGEWQPMDCPLSTGFHALLVLNDDELLLAGGRYFVDQGGFRGELVHYRHGEFHNQAHEAGLPRLRALRAYKDGVLLVGDKGHLLYLHNNKVHRLACNTHHDLMDIVTLGSDEALVVGDFGTLMTAAPDFEKALVIPHREVAAQSRWETMASPTRRQLWGLWQAHDGQMYACGDVGTVLRLDGEQWVALPAPDEQLAVHCLWSCEGSGLLAGGQEGRIYRFNGEQWQLHFDLHLHTTILAMWGTEPDCIYAVGDEGLVLHYDGLGWRRLASGTGSALYDLWGLDGRHLLAVGDFGLALRYNGEQWKEFSTGTEQFIYSVWGRGLNDIYAVGLSGTVVHFNGQRWHTMPTRLQQDLLSVSGNDTGEVFAVGGRGTVLRLEQGQWLRETTPTEAGLRAVCATRNGTVYAVGDKGCILRRRFEPE